MAPSLLLPVLLLLGSAVPVPEGSPKPVMAQRCPADINVTPSEESKTIKTKIVTNYEDIYLFVHPERDFRGVSLEEGESHRQLAWFPLSDCLPQGSLWYFLLEVKRQKFKDEEQFDFQLRSGDCLLMCSKPGVFSNPLRLHIVAHGPSGWTFGHPSPCFAHQVPGGRPRAYDQQFTCKEFPSMKTTTTPTTTTTITTTTTTHPTTAITTTTTTRPTTTITPTTTTPPTTTTLTPTTTPTTTTTTTTISSTATTTATTSTTLQAAATHPATAPPVAKQDTVTWLSTDVVVMVVLLVTVVVMIPVAIVALKRFRQRRNSMEEPIYHNVVDPSRPIVPPRQRADVSQGITTEVEDEDNIYEEIDDLPRWAVVAGTTRAGMRQSDGYVRTSGSTYYDVAGLSDVVDSDGYLAPRPAPQ